MRVPVPLHEHMCSNTYTSRYAYVCICIYIRWLFNHVLNPFAVHVSAQGGHTFYMYIFYMPLLTRTCVHVLNVDHSSSSSSSSSTHVHCKLMCPTYILHIFYMHIYLQTDTCIYIQVGHALYMCECVSLCVCVCVCARARACAHSTCSTRKCVPV